MNRENLRKEIQLAINRNSAENGSNTPDFVLADYLMDCLEAYNKAVTARNALSSYPPFLEGSLSRIML